MITKSLRYSLIAAACLKLGTGQRVNSVLHPSRHDIAEETSLARERDNGTLPVDDDLPSLASALPFERAEGGDNGESVLSPAERAQLARDLARHRADMARRYPVNFVLVS